MLAKTPTVGSQGAYLIVERAPAKLAAMGVGAVGTGTLPAGAGTVSGRGLEKPLALQQPIRRITYAGGKTCTIAEHRDRNGHGGLCLPPVGYATQKIRVPGA